MPDLLIRGLSASDLDRLDDRARSLGLTRTEFLRRHLHSEAQRVEVRVSASDLVAFADLASDLADPTVMGDAWS